MLGFLASVGAKSRNFLVATLIGIVFFVAKIANSIQCVWIGGIDIVFFVTKIVFFVTKIANSIQCVWIVGIGIVFFVTKIANSIQCVWIVGIGIVFFCDKECQFNTMHLDGWY